MKKRIGIVTCSREANYGACLQAYATQLIIEKSGYDAEILNYSLEPDKAYSPLRQKNIRSVVASILFYSLRKKQALAFDTFHKRMKFSEKKIREGTDAFLIKDDYDVLLVGSDQVWNPYLGFDLDLSLLRFYDDGPARVSYGSSFGVSELPNELEESYRSGLSKFDRISTRELQGSNIIEQLLGKKPAIVLDPTMLLSGKDWLEHASEYPIEEDYILIYDQNHSAELIPTALQAAKELGCKIYVLSTIKYNKKHFENLIGISPDQFLYIISKAKFVITDSFHGTVFSMLMHREFAACCGGSAERLKSRITNLLTQFDLETRWIDTDCALQHSHINYEAVDRKLEIRRQESLAYLQEGLMCSNKGKRTKDNSMNTSCSGCGLCEQTCPTKAICMQRDDEGFLYPLINSDKCVSCGICRDICPHLGKPTNARMPETYIARSCNSEVLMSSSSGGLFTALSDEILKTGNASVYGAVYDDAFGVKHIRAASQAECNLMKGSKYVQSTLQDIYDFVKEDLNSGREVLFTGTPCQCSAVLRYAKKNKLDTTHLVLCDVICHGVPSPRVWQDYLQSVRHRYGDIQSIRFRNKEYSDAYYMTIETNNGTYAREDIADPFVYIFSHNLAIRPSCICCRFKSFLRETDITIGDFHAVKIYFPEYCDGKGVSVVLVNTDKGRELFQKAQNQLEVLPCSLKQAMQINLKRSALPTSRRNAFMKMYKEKGYESSVQKFTEENPKKHMIGTSKRAIRRLLKR